jgi:rod shape determining protein RodA
MNQILIHLKKLDWLIILCVIFLISIGLLSIYSSSKEDFLNFKKQLFFSFVGFFLMILISFFDWRPLKENPYLILFFYFLCLISLVSLLFFAPEIRGVRSWYNIGPVSIDPTEFTKIVLLLVLAKYFSMRHVEMYRITHILISGLYVLIPSILISLQPDLGSVLVLVALWIGVLIISGIRIWHFFLLLLLAIFLFAIGWNTFLKEYQKERILSFLFPHLSDPLKVGWSQNQSKIAIGSGGVWGKGINKGSQVQLGFLPEPQTDFIFAAISEEMGFIGISFFFFIFSILIWRIFRISISAKSNFARIFSLGYAFLLVSQAFIHIGTNVGILPITGLTLPFLSYGGSNLLANFIGLGIIQSIKVHTL